MFWNNGPTTSLVLIVMLVLLFFVQRNVDKRLDAVEDRVTALEA